MDARGRPNPTERRRRQVRWAHRLRRIGRAWDNALELARAGRLTAPYGAPFELVHHEPVYRLRRYAHDAAEAAPAAPLLLVPPLMIAAEVYDISPDVSAVAYLARAGVDVWLVDFGAPEREEGGMSRTLDDHVRAVSEAIERVRTATGRDVHLAGYSQGGMFCYQAAAFRRAAGVASIVTFGSPVDLHRTLQVGEGATERLLGGLRAALAWPLARIEGLPGVLTSTGFKLFSARKEVRQLVDFVKNLHDREALEKREAKRLFLGGEGFVAWPGPAFRKFVDDLVVGNRMASGGFVIDGHTVTLADITCPILYIIGSRDEMGRPAALRGIQRASPRVRVMYELPVTTGHFGMVVGSTALSVTWPSVVGWMRWLEGHGGPPAAAIDVRADAGATTAGDAADDDDPADGGGPTGLDLELARALLDKTARVVVDRLSELSVDLGDYLDSARYQLPRLARLRHLQDDSRISFSKTLADQAREIGDRTFFLFRGRAFSYADANRRVDAVVRGLVASGIRPGDRVGVMMKSRPSHLSVVTAINRIGAVAVLLSPATPDDVLSRALALGEAEVLIVDPDGAARARAAIPGRILVLGGVGEVPWQPGARRELPAGVVDLEAIDPEAVALPAWYRPDPGRARDLAMVFLSTGRDAPLRAMRITNRRWAFSALGAAAAATLTTRDTVYCCLPLHHPSGTLVATGSALISGARLALASAELPDGFWDEVRRYGATVVYYAGEMCRWLVDAPPVLGENNNPVRLFAGSGLRAGVWRRLVDRFGPVGVLEMYASTEAHIVLANARGKKLGSVGRPLPGSPDVAIAAWSLADDDFVRDGAGRLVHARLDEPGMLIAALGTPSSTAGADLAHIDPRRIVNDALVAGDRWFVTGDLFRVDAEGDYWFVDQRHHMIATRNGPVASTRIEDALYEVPGVALCAVAGRPDPEAELGGGSPAQVAIAAIQLHPGAASRGIDLDALSRAVAALPEHARPRRIRIVGALAMTDGYRPIKQALARLDLSDGPAVLAWDPHAQRYRPTVAPAARSA
ncbi:MAG TPA: alpha/beta fold hydrolase [Kofleriaceae bacterium]|jgi:putative long chain acyl-CoA synthase|nr:alpha/beta fold hydrolase [Kofleriaceae bacterium]